MDRSSLYNVPWKRLSRETLHQNPWWQLDHDKVERPDGSLCDYYLVNAKDSSFTVPYQDGKILLIEQYRYTTDEVLIEVPAGGGMEGRTPEEVAHIELREEAGYDAKTLKYLGHFAAYAGLGTENAHIYLATDLTEIGSENGEGEFIRIFWKSVEEVKEMIANNTIRDGMSIAALAMALPHIEKLGSTTP